MNSPLANFLYVLMRDHLPVGTTSWLVDRATLPGDPKSDLQGLEAIAEQLAAKLLDGDAPPEVEAAVEEVAPGPWSQLTKSFAGGSDAEGDTGRQAERQDPPAADPAPAPPAQEKKNTGAGTGDGKASKKTVESFITFLHDRGGRCRPADFDALGKSNATRARVIRELRTGGKVHVEYERTQRVIVLNPESCTCTWSPLVGHAADEREPGRDCPAHPDMPAPPPTSGPDHDDAGEGAKPADPAGDTGGGNHDDGAAEAAADGRGGREHRGSDGGGRESGSADVAAHLEDNALDNMGDLNGAGGETRKPSRPPAPKPSDDEQLALMTDFFNQATEDVWPREVEATFDLTDAQRRRLIPILVERGAVKVVGGGPQVRYRSSRFVVDAAELEPTGDGTVHLRDASGDRLAEAEAEAAANESSAEKALPAVREWVRGAGTFSPRQLRNFFTLEPAACTRVLATLSREGAIRRVGEDRAETYEAVAAGAGNGNGGGPRGKRPLSGGADGSTLEGRALAALHGDGMTLTNLGARLGVSEEVTKTVIGKLYRDGEVRARSRGDELLYAATA